MNPEQGNKGPSSNEQDLKQREYRDKDGNVHHHTRTSQEYQEQQGEKKEGE